MVPESSGAPAMQQLWAQAVDQVKREVIAPSLWRALEQTIPIAWENNTFVIGTGGAEGQQASQMNSSDHRAVIERTLRGLASNNDLALRVIEGTTRGDWEDAKARDAAAVQQRQQTTQKRVQQSASFGSWDEVHDQVSRLWASSEHRSLASGRARYLDQALTLLGKAMDALVPTGGQTDDLTERGLSRVIERISSTANADPTMVALTLFERRRRGSE